MGQKQCQVEKLKVIDWVRLTEDTLQGKQEKY